MGAVRRIFTGFARNWRGAPLGRRRVWLAALGGALAVLVVTGMLVLFGGAGPTATPRAALVNPTASDAATGTDTATASATATHANPKATATVFHPPQRPPAPPSPPTPPPVTPTVTLCPTATPPPTAPATRTAAASAPATPTATAAGGRGAAGPAACP